MRHPSNLSISQSDLLSRVRVAVNSVRVYDPLPGRTEERVIYGQIDYSKVSDLIGRKCNASKIPADAQGTFTAHNGIVVKLYQSKGRVSFRTHRKGWKRLFIVCPCGAEVEAGHFHQHIGSVTHTKGIAKPSAEETAHNRNSWGEGD
jgi:hypothetical protein